MAVKILPVGAYMDSRDDDFMETFVFEGNRLFYDFPWFAGARISAESRYITIGTKVIASILYLQVGAGIIRIGIEA